MSCEAGAENRWIAVRACVDAEVDGRPSFRIDHHPEFDHLQSKALHIGQKLGRSGKRIRGNGPEDDTKADLDLIDRKILSILRNEGRLAINELANRVGLSSSPCWSRVRRLEAIGVIKHYSAVIDDVAIGLKDIVFIEVTLDKHNDKVLSRFGDALARIPEVIEAYLVTGEYDYLVKVAVADTSHYERFLRQKLYRIQGIRHTRSTFSLRTLKLVISADPLLVNADA